MKLITKLLERCVFASRWLLAPMYIGLGTVANKPTEI